MEVLGIIDPKLWGVGFTIVSRCHYCVQVSRCSFFLFSNILKLFSFTLLVFFTWSFEISKCPSTELTTWSTIVWLVWGVHYCVQLLPEVIFSNIPFTFSFAKTFFSYGISMVLLLGFYGSPMGFPWCFYDISGGFLWDFWRGAMGVLW